ncbi:predicted protein [Sparassis crispa]|uniref:Meiotically up-regulated protein Msb1/Mug8 domain-containing protein n=1 Tax=Sparassis crispa TaxID=139825 RepID=A0A401GXR4_9APHY|nr:predicted protein [Sparassis crispa]GBE87016.1 predicted protein [Sparassis crispa]
MPSFLSKVFTRKRDEKDTSRKRSSVASLLEGKFEAVSPTISRSAAQISEPTQSKEKEKEKDAGFSLFRAKSPVSPNDSSKSTSDAPHLTLNLPVPKEEKSRALGVVFEADPEDRRILSDSVVGERRLSPLEALLLVKACSTAIVERGGLETLGVMHPHWYSASPEVQRRLISLFILSLAPKGQITTLTPTPTSPILIFNTELEYTRSPHDIAAVLRWALRHLRLEGDSFGRHSVEGTSVGHGEAQWQWYTQFVAAERAAAYPPSAFSALLVPQLPPAHLQLLVSTLEIVSSLAAHSERSGVSGSKLSKVLGLWLLSTRRTGSDDDWTSFYARWERAGRILEHLFLAQIRDEMVHKKMPLRLSELVQSYPYNKGGTTAEEDGLLPRPRLSSRRYDALFVRVETQLPDHKTAKPKQHPLRLIADAIKAEANTTAGTYDALWEIIKKAASVDETEGSSPLLEEDRYPTLSRIFSDETIRLLSLIPIGNSDASSPTIQVSGTPISRVGRPVRRRSTSLGSAPNGNSTNGKASDNVTHEKAASHPQVPESPKDWMDFSTSGFGESALGRDFAKTLLDNDVEVTNPPEVSRKSSKRRKASPDRSRRSSADNPAASTVNHHPVFSTKTVKAKATIVNMVKLDEAFVDFWSDALLDPIVANWPSFVVCQLKPLPSLEAGGRPVEWLVLEQAFTRPPPPQEPQPTSPVRTSSPRPSVRSNISSSRRSSTFSAARKRFTFFSSNTISSVPEVKTAVGRKMPSRVNELGEILAEEEEKHTVSPIGSSGQSKGPGLTGVAVVTAAARVAATKTDELPPVPVVEMEQAVAPREGVTAILPIRTEDQAAEKPLVAVPQEVDAPSDGHATQLKTKIIPEDKVLPPAPEPVVPARDTPGPNIALNTGEPVVLAGVSAQAVINEIPSNVAPTAAEQSAPSTAEPIPQHEELVLEPTVELQESPAIPAKEALADRVTSNIAQDTENGRLINDAGEETREEPSPDALEPPKTEPSAALEGEDKPSSSTLLGTRIEEPHQNGSTHPESEADAAVSQFSGVAP